jgi:hypothetical protein
MTCDLLFICFCPAVRPVGKRTQKVAILFRESSIIWKKNNYDIIPDVNVAEIARYVAMVREFETRYPPEDLSAQDEEVEELE